jgi:hypothetical protein
MTMPIWLFGVAKEVVPLVKEVVRAIQQGKPDEAAKAAQRAAEMQAFKLLQRKRTGDI